MYFTRWAATLFFSTTFLASKTRASPASLLNEKSLEPHKRPVVREPTPPQGTPTPGAEPTKDPHPERTKYFHEPGYV
jgi:hypothetical protein